MKNETAKNVIVVVITTIVTLTIGVLAYQRATGKNLTELLYNDEKDIKVYSGDGIKDKIDDKTEDIEKVEVAKKEDLTSMYPVAKEVYQNYLTHIATFRYGVPEECIDSLGMKLERDENRNTIVYDGKWEKTDTKYSKLVEKYSEILGKNMLDEFLNKYFKNVNGVAYTIAAGGSGVIADGISSVDDLIQTDGVYTCKITVIYYEYDYIEVEKVETGKSQVTFKFEKIGNKYVMTEHM